MNSGSEHSNREQAHDASLAAAGYQPVVTPARTRTQLFVNKQG